MSSARPDTRRAPVVAPAEPTQSRQLEISNAVVRIYKHYLGRGPRSARTHLSEDLVVVILAGCLTRAERSLYEAGQQELLLSQRHAIQQLMADEMIAAVQGIVGRSVVSFMSTNDPEKEIGAEVFVLDGRSVAASSQLPAIHA